MFKKLKNWLKNRVLEMTAEERKYEELFQKELMRRFWKKHEEKTLWWKKYWEEQKFK